MAQGLLVFHSLDEALKAGWSIYDRTPTGYLVRRQNVLFEWALAIVDLSPVRI